MPGTRFQVDDRLKTNPPSQLSLALDNKKFCSYHAANPHIYKKFEDVTLQTIAKGFKNYSAKGIFEIIRWNTGLAAYRDCFKINNNYTAYYARLFEDNNPQHKDFFRKRESKFD
jgi:hypothetical protein